MALLAELAKSTAPWQQRLEAVLLPEGHDPTTELKQQLLKEIGILQMRPLPVVMADTVPYLTEVTVREDGMQEVASMAERRGWWLKLGSTQYPLVAAAAARPTQPQLPQSAPGQPWAA